MTENPITTPNLPNNHIPNKHNRLSDEKSLYLRQHKDNPVNWYGWCDQAFIDARERGVSVMISIGYAACHWCHVMAHESFADPETAALINQNFVAVKIDREERPDLDALYMKAVTLMGVDGGWPLTIFVTPDRIPFWGGTYFPPTPRYGRPSFRQILQQIAQIYRNEPERVAIVAEQMQDSLQQTTGSRKLTNTIITDQAQPEPDQILASAAERLYPIMDLEQGGIQGAPKFPHTSLMNLFWQAYLRLGKAQGDKKWHDLVTLTLDKICAGGIYDHLGGGFARYVTDDRWLVPHFEKMLYDNGQMIALLSWVWQDTQHPIYASRVAETIAWLEREMLMRDHHGDIIGFAASLDADSLDATGHLHEGAFYVWDKTEIDQVLDTDAEIFNAIYGVQAGGNWEGKNILNLLAHEGSALGEPAFQQKHLTIREKLFKEREKRLRPQRDEKILADWNGLAILGIARAGLVFDRNDWVALAENAWQGIFRHLQLPQTNLPEKNPDASLPLCRLSHSFAGGVASHPASLDDYAFLGLAAIELFQATGKTDYIDQAEKLVETVNKHYRDAENGGYYFAADDTKDVIIRPKLLEDNATPSGQGAMLHNLASLYYLTGHDLYRAQAEEMVQNLAPIWQKNLLGGCSMILASSRLAHMVQIALFGTKSDPEFQAMWRVAAKCALPDRLLISVDSSEPPAHLQNNPNAPLFGKSAVNGRATCYVCIGQICSLPIQTADALEKYLGMIAQKRKLISQNPSEQN